MKIKLLIILSIIFTFHLNIYPNKDTQRYGKDKPIYEGMSVTNDNAKPFKVGSHDASPMMQSSNSTLYGLENYKADESVEYSNSQDQSQTYNLKEPSNKAAPYVILSLLIIPFIIIVIIAVSNLNSNEISSNNHKPTKRESEAQDNIDNDKCLLDNVLSQAALYNNLTELFDTKVTAVFQTTLALDIDARNYLIGLQIENYSNKLKQVDYTEMGVTKFDSERIISRIENEMKQRYLNCI